MLRLCGKYVLCALFWGYLAVSVCIGVISLAPPFFTGVIINQLASGSSVRLGRVALLCFLLATLQIGQAALTYLSEMLYVNLQSHAGYRLNLDTLEHIKRLPQDFFVHFDASYYNQQINHDANDLIIFVIGSIVQVVSNAVSLLTIFSVLLILNARLGLVCAALVAVGGGLYCVFRQSLFNKSFDMQEQSARFFSRLQDQLDKVAFLRRHVLFRRFRDKLSLAFDELYPTILANQKVTSGFALSNSVVRSLAQGVLLVVGAIEVADGRLLPGYLVTVVGYYGSLSAAIQHFLTWGKDYQANRVCYKRLRRIWDIQEEQDGEAQLDEVDEIECRQVGFSYPGTDKTVFVDRCLYFKKGMLYGISGANGVGKSTLLEILLGMYPDDTAGSVLYNGIDQLEIDRYALRVKNIGVAEQEPPILEDTIEANLMLLSPGQDTDKVNKYIDALGLREMVSVAPNGLETILDERRQNISGGEKQKIAIIRLLLQNPSVMLLDEPTSALDRASRSALIEILQQKKRDHIVIVVSHDSDLLEACDAVIEL